MARKEDASTLPSSSSVRHHRSLKEEPEEEGFIVDLREIVQPFFLSILFIFFTEHGRLDDRSISLILSSRLTLFYGEYLSYRAIDTIGIKGEDRFLADKVNVEDVEKYLFALDFVFEAIVLSRVYVRAVDYISR